jgi:hypothetical protein
MTANELADKLKIYWHYENSNLFEEAATMLRQQQAEIQALRNHRAWIKETAIKELTYEEIDQIIKQHDWYSKTWVDMVRSIESAIKKKAGQ